MPRGQPILHFSALSLEAGFMVSFLTELFWGPCLAGWL